MNPTTDDLTVARAAEIHAEGRTIFVYGPAPYAWELDIKHPATGRKWVVRVSAHLDESGVDALNALLDAVGRAGTPDAMARGLAYLSACSEVIGGQFARSVSE